LARETIRNWIPRMERYEWILSQPAGKSNAGKQMVNYTLTKKGCFQAACLNPALRQCVRRILGDSYREIEEARASATKKRARDYFERWLPTIRQVLESGTAQPGFYYCLELTTDKAGKVHLGKCKVGIVQPS